MSELDNRDIINLIERIKRDIVDTRNEILRNANQQLIAMYFRIGKSISENSTYGSNFINTLSASLKSEFPDVTGFSPRNLSRMKKFYEEYRDQPNLPPAVAKSDLNLAEKFRFVRDMIMIPFIDKCSISDSLS